MSIFLALSLAFQVGHAERCGDHWDNAINDDGAEELMDIVWGRHQFVAVGVGKSGFISPNGKAWRKHPIIDTGTISSIAWGKHMFVALGERSIFISLDGLAWTKRFTLNPTISKAEFHDIAYGRGKFIAVGQQEKLYHSAPLILTSEDGINWIDRSPNYNSAAQISAELIYDGILSSIAWGGNHFVAVGSSGLVLTSRNGITWNKRTHIPGLFDLYGITWGNRRFVTVSYQWINSTLTPVIFASSNGLNWLNVSPTRQQGSLQDAIWNGRQFIAVGTNWTGSGNKVIAAPVILTSKNGLKWVNKSPSGQAVLSSVAWGGKQLVVVGSTEVTDSTGTLIGYKPLILTSNCQ